MIGVFDSGLGGMQSLEYLREVLPNVSYLYLGDTKYLPYGDKSPTFLHERTLQCLHRLFDQGCSLVILACNTASAYAIKDRQDTFPEKKVLSVTMPGIETIVERGYHCVGLLATAMTVQSGLYPDMMRRHFPDYQINFTLYNGAGLVELLEVEADKKLIYQKLREIFGGESTYSQEALVLGSTHYPLLIPYLQDILGPIHFINPAWEAAEKLPTYLLRHPEIVIVQDGKVRLCVTGEVISQYGAVERIDL